MFQMTVKLSNFNIVIPNATLRQNFKYDDFQVTPKTVPIGYFIFFIQYTNWS